MDDRAEPPSWRSGAGPVSAQGGRVATGGGAPAGDQGEEDGQSQAQAADGHQGYTGDSAADYAGSGVDYAGSGVDYAGSGASADNDQAPGFGDAGQGAPPPSFSDPSHTEFADPFAPGYGGSAASDGHHPGLPDTPEVRQGGAPGQFGAAPGPGDGPPEYYGDPPAAAPGPGPYGGPAPAFGGPALAFGGPAPAGPGLGGYSTGAPDYSGGTPATFDDGQFNDPFSNGPMYGGAPSPGTATGDPGPAYSPPYSTSPVQSARDKVTASLKAAKRVKTPKRSSRPGRQAQLTVARVEPWSVMKFSFVISLVAFIVLFVAVAVLYGVLSGLGVFDALQRTVSSITSSQGSSGFNIQSWLSASRVLGYTGLLGAINVVLITAVCTVGSVLYNITAELAGGVEVTLKETE